MTTPAEIRAAYEILSGTPSRASDKEFFAQADPALLSAALLKIQADALQVSSLSSLVRAKVIRDTSTQTINDLTPTLINFNNGVYDKGGIASTGTAPIAVPRTNEYLVKAYIAFDAGQTFPANSVAQLDIMIAGSAAKSFVFTPAASTAAFTPNGSDVLAISESQTVGVQLTLVVGGNKDISIASGFESSLTVIEQPIIA